MSPPAAAVLILLTAAARQIVSALPADAPPGGGPRRARYDSSHYQADYAGRMQPAAPLKHDSSNFTVNNVELCASPDIFMMVIVCSAVGNFDKRKAIRDSWGGYVASKQDLRLVFLVGKYADHVDSSSASGALWEENAHHHDVIQGDFIDNYKNLTLKSMSMLRWLHSYCPVPPKFILKSDDDIFINVPLLVRDLRNTVHTHFLMGQLIAGARPTRDPTSTWFTSQQAYPYTYFPEYMSGCAYVMSGDVVEDLYMATFEVEPLWIEDVYITGMCARTVAAKHLFNGKFGYRVRTRDPCVYRNVITAHRLGSVDLREMWRQTFDEEVKC